MHASIQERCRALGFDNLSPIIWHKMANAVYEVDGGGGFLGKPYEPNSVIKNDIEFLLMQRKPGGYRTPTVAERVLSVISAENHKKWFQQIWTGLTGASTKNHPAPYPLELAERLKTGRKDAGARGAVTGGAQMNGFVRLIRTMLSESGVAEASIHVEKKIELPGYFRPEKKWDLLVIVDKCLIASIEFKSQIGPSFGNNYNNRTEEALGSATDIWAAYREGAFKPSSRPWLGYLMLLEETPRSMRPVRAQEPHFKVFPEFKFAQSLLARAIALKKTSAASRRN